MDYFARVERDLAAAVRRGANRPWYRRRPATGDVRTSRPLIAVVACLVMGGTAYAATQVLREGAPVEVPAHLNPAAGSGVPAPGGSELLPLEVPDPQGGPPWGLRLVRTTRGLLCVQVARVQGGSLGELGVDGSFGDDGRFHPLPSSALPDAGGELGHGYAEVGTDGYCHLPAEAFLGDSIGVERSAAGPADTTHRPRGQLRDLYFGLLGPQAVSVGWTAGGASHTEAVVPGVGAFLLVTGTSPGDQVATGGGSIGSDGGLAPVAPLTAIGYRLHGSLCERLLPGVRPARPCPPPQALYPRARPVTGRAMHEPLRVSLEVSAGVLRDVAVSFRAPFAVTDASRSYAVRVPIGRCHGPLGGYAEQPTDRDIAAGARVTVKIGDPFQDATCGRRAATVEVVYSAGPLAERVIGRKRIVEPRGVRSLPLPHPRRG